MLIEPSHIFTVEKQICVMRFIRNNCLIKENMNIRKKDLLKAIKNYFIEKKYECQLKMLDLSRILKKTFPKIKIIKHKNPTYRGIQLNQSGLKYLNDDYQNTIVNAKKKEIITQGSACKLLSCSYAIKKLKTIVETYNNLKNKDGKKINLLKAKRILKDLEKCMFRRNLHRKSQIKIGFVLMLTTNVSQREIANLLETTEVSIRALNKKFF